jgi:hypothetical protein
MKLRLESTLALALAASALLTACDNPACVFGGTCSGTGTGGGGIVGNTATVPGDHNWLSSAGPTVTNFLPTGNSISKDTPIVVVFSESMAASTLTTGTLRVLPDSGTAIPVVTFPPTLVGDGRVLIVVPVQALTLGTAYHLEYVADSVVTDLQGTEILQPSDRVIGRFTVATTNPATAKVLMTFPFDNATNQSTTGEYDVVFDRKINPATMNVDAFAVTVGGVTPANNPIPQPMTITVSGLPSVETRVWRYRSLESSGAATEFPTSTAVSLTLSPTGHKILASDASAVPATTVDYTTAAFAAPTTVEIVSTPTDAIGIDNLTAVNPLQVGLQLIGAQANDKLGIFVFGKSTVVPTPPAQPVEVALYRERRLGDIASFDALLQTVTIGEPELDIASSTSPVTGRVADGSLSIGVILKRGTVSSPIRMLDTDTTEAGLQAALLDTVRPTLLGFGTSGTNTSTLRGDLRDLTVLGRASEQLSIAEVSTTLGNNGALAPVVASDTTGLFVAQPIALGVIDPALMPVAFTLTIYDHAMNRAVATSDGTFTQLGVAGPGSALPGNPTVDVEVFDARTLAPISGAKVFTHEDVAGAFSLLGNGLTSAAGAVSLTAGATGETLVTVDAANYDLFTFHGVPNSRISIPLTRSGTVDAQVQGVLSTTSTDLPQFDRFVADNRSPESDEPEVAVQTCTISQSTATFQCGFGPLSARPGFFGAQSFVGVETPLSAFSFTAPGFLRAYALQMPLAALTPGQNSTVNLTVNSMLDDPGVDQEERALDGPLAVLNATTLNGVDLNDLDQAPRVEIQAIARGFHGAVLAGFGAALDGQGSPASLWAVRSAIPGAADPTSGKYPGDVQGQLVTDGTIESDLFLRCELRDNSGNRAGRRPRFSVAGSVVAPLSVPLVSSPAASSTTPGPEYDVVFDNVLLGGGQDGLYRVTLLSDSGRAWTLYRFTAAAGATHSVHTPDILSAGGTPLPAGVVSCSAAAFAWPTFDRTLFAFTDIEREQDLFAESASFDFSQL